MDLMILILQGVIIILVISGMVIRVSPPKSGEPERRGDRPVSEWYCAKTEPPIDTMEKCDSRMVVVVTSFGRVCPATYHRAGQHWMWCDQKPIDAAIAWTPLPVSDIRHWLGDEEA